MLILASQSPRRKELMSLAGFIFSVTSPDVEETYSPGMNVREVPQYLAEKKASASLKATPDKDSVIVAADTIVLLDGIIYGKPADEQDALRMLKQLNGKMHEVITGVSILSSGRSFAFSDTTRVFFNQLTDDELAFYIQQYQPFDKAGSYGIQDWMGVRGVERIEGDYFNVMGLPINRVARALKEFGIV